MDEIGVTDTNVPGLHVLYEWNGETLSILTVRTAPPPPPPMLDIAWTLPINLKD